MPFGDRALQATVPQDHLAPCAFADDMQSGLFAFCEVNFYPTSQAAKCQAGGNAKPFATDLHGFTRIRNGTMGVVVFSALVAESDPGLVHFTLPDTFRR